MSHFSQIKTKLSNKECLVAALNELALQPKVFATAQNLRGFYGSQEEYKAEIIIPGKSISCRADIGFKWNDATGVYELIRDPYETDPLLGRNFFSHQLLEKYGEQVIRATATQLSQQLGECTIAASREGTRQTLRLTFSAHQNTQQHTRR